jgi:SAM-dependent methyltransferase
MGRGKREYLPALGRDWLTPLYDPLIRVTTRELRFKRRLVEDARIAAAHRVLDVGCGTGTLLLLVKERSEGATPLGLDGDEKVLGIARSKARKRGERLSLVRAFSFDIPFAEGSFDRVLSSLMLHHLTRPEKLGTLREIFRVLRPGGELHVADWGRPRNALMMILSVPLRLADGLHRTADNVKGLLPALFRDAGFEAVSENVRFATVFGTMSLFSARRPRAVE